MAGLTKRELFALVLANTPLRTLAEDDDNQRNLHPALHKVTVPVRGLDRRLHGMRIGQISDVHVGAVLGVDHLEKALRAFGRYPPDLLAVTGDLLDDASQASACFELLSRVRSPYGRFFVMGNHDNYAGRDKVLRAARSHAAPTTLVNQGELVDVQGARFLVGGVDYPNIRARFKNLLHVHERNVGAALQRAPDADFRLCLVHHPDCFDVARTRGAELTLSGHTHGGQVAPLGPFMANRIFNYVLGHYVAGDSHLYVNGGTGHWFPLRVGVPAEVTELTLVRA
ncbi:MAG: metallophosphoesterase [Myxococcota bacterium]